MAWKCPQCGEINYKDSLIRCLCGNEISGQEVELYKVTIPAAKSHNNFMNKDGYPFLKLKSRRIFLWFIFCNLASLILIISFGNFVAGNLDSSWYFK